LYYLIGQAQQSVTEEGQQEGKTGLNDHSENGFNFTMFQLAQKCQINVG